MTIINNSNRLKQVNLKILSYNIHKGFDWKSQNYFLAEMKQLINSVGADLVFLQEVTGQNAKLKNNGQPDIQFEFLADSIWPHYAYAKNAVYDHGHHGNLILSQYPILSWENINLSTNYFEKRGLLLGLIEIPKNKKRIFAGCLHLNLLHFSRQKQYLMIQKKLQTLNLVERDPLIIAGDFNDWNQKATQVFEGSLGMKDAYKTTHGTFAKTFPAQLPVLSLDRIYVKNLKVKNSQVLSKKKRQQRNAFTNMLYRNKSKALGHNRKRLLAWQG